MTLSAEMRSKVIQQLFEGLSVRESHLSLRRHIKSKTTIANVRDEFLRYEEDKEAELGETQGLYAAAGVWRVTPIVSRLVEISAEARKAKVEIHELPGSVLVARALQGSNVDQKDLQRFVSEVYRRSQEKGLGVNDIINNCEDLNSLEEEYGSFDKITKEWTEIGFKLSKSRGELKDIEEEASAATKRRDDALAKAKTTEAAVEDFVATKNKLVSIGVSLDDVESTKNVFTNLKEQKFNPKRVVSKLKTIDSLEGGIAKQKGEIAKGEGLLGEQQEELDSIKDEIKAHSELLKEGRAIEDTGLTVAQIAKLRKTVTRISSARGIATGTAMSRFEEEVEQKYDPVLGFEQSLKASAKEKELADGELKHQREVNDQLKQENADLDRQNQRKGKEIAAYSRLRKRGVTDSDIMRWDRIVFASGLTPGDMQSELVRIGSLSTLEARIKARVEAEKAESERLRAENVELRRRHASDWDSVAQFERLRQKGVDVKAMRRWAKLVVESGLEPDKLEEELMAQKTLNGTRKEREKELDRLASQSVAANKEIMTLRGETERLEARKSGLEESIQALVQESKKEIRRIADDAEKKTRGVRTTARAELRGFAAEAKQDLNTSVSNMQTKVNGATSDVGERVGEIKGQFQEMKDDAVKMLTEVEEAGERMARLEPIQSAYEFIGKGKGDLTEKDIFPIATQFLEKLKEWEEKRNRAAEGLTYNTSQLDDAIEELDENWMSWRDSKRA